MSTPDLTGRPPAPLASISRKWAGVAALLACLGLTLWWTRPPAELVLVQGTTVLQGQFTLQASELTVQVEGRAVVTVHAPAGAGPDSGQGTLSQADSPAPTSAPVSVTVEAGLVRIDQPGQDPVVLRSGQSKRFEPGKPGSS